MSPLHGAPRPIGGVVIFGHHVPNGGGETPGPTRHRGGLLDEGVWVLKWGEASPTDLKDGGATMTPHLGGHYPP